MKIMKNHPEILSQREDKLLFKLTSHRYDMSWYMLIGSFPLSFYLTR